jgi:hypothetical protein
MDDEGIIIFLFSTLKGKDSPVGTSNNKVRTKFSYFFIRSTNSREAVVVEENEQT